MIFSLDVKKPANKNTTVFSLLHSSCKTASTSSLFFPFNSLYFVSPCRRLLGIITKKDILRHMAQMANQDPESIMFNWSAPSRTAGGEGETTARRRWASWTAPISDIRIFLFSFQLCRPWTSQTDCGPQRLLLAMRGKRLCYYHCGCWGHKEVTGLKAHTWRMHFLHTHTQNKHTLLHLQTPQTCMLSPFTHTRIQ